MLGCELTIFHCIAHILALALGDAVKLLPDHWIPHLRAMHRVFSKSTKMFAELTDIFEGLRREMEKLDSTVSLDGEMHMWRITTFKVYCKCIDLYDEIGCISK
jgi:hypothetical protein